jgi:hypothetical protein
MPVQQAPLHRLTPVEVFANAETLQKLIVVALVASAVAAVVVLALKLRSGQRLSGGSAFLSGLRLGGPILGGFGACLSLLNMTIGYATVPGDLPLKVLAPGFAEAFLVVGLGFLAGVVAVIANWLVESRIDRSVLKA